MHELSIAMSIVDMATEEAEARGARVEAVHLRLGALSGLVPEALLASYGIACDATPLEGSRLVIENVPIVIFCPRCRAEREAQSTEWFCCAVCGASSADVVRGREIEVVALELSG